MCDHFTTETELIEVRNGDYRSLLFLKEGHKIERNLRRVWQTILLQVRSPLYAVEYSDNTRDGVL